MERSTLSMLIVDEDDHWIKAVHSVAESLNFDPIDIAHSQEEALASDVYELFFGGALASRVFYDLSIVGVSVGREILICARALRLATIDWRYRLGIGQKGVGAIVAASATGKPEIAREALRPVNGGSIADDIIMKSLQPEKLAPYFRDYKAFLLEEKQRAGIES